MRRTWRWDRGRQTWVEPQEQRRVGGGTEKDRKRPARNAWEQKERKSVCEREIG